MSWLDTFFKRDAAVAIVGGQFDGGIDATVSGNSRRGQVCVQFGDPVNLRAYMNELAEHPASQIVPVDVPDVTAIITCWRYIPPQNLRKK